MNLQTIPAAEVRSWWTYVKPGLEKILAKSPEDWLPEDIYAACIYNGASLLICIKDNAPCGFMVVIARGEAWHVWCAWSDSHVLDDGLAALEEMARLSNVKRLTFESWRRGWDKLAKKNGFHARSWVKELI
jgi:hypothetical protein